MIDLEHLADHRGSVLGGVKADQPSQKWFESALAAAIVGLDPAQPVFVEAESAAIGAIRLPPSLWAAMIAAPRIEIAAPRAARAQYLVAAYGTMIADKALLKDRLTALIPFQGRAQVEAWFALIDAGEFQTLAQSLCALHYDPSYMRARARHAPEPSIVLDTVRLEDDDICALAERALSAAEGVMARRPAQRQ